MSAAVEDVSASAQKHKSEKRHKKHKDYDKKRPREYDDPSSSTNPRKHKRSKSEAVDVTQSPTPADEHDGQERSSIKKYKKSKKAKEIDAGADVNELLETTEDMVPETAGEASASKHKKKKDKKPRAADGAELGAFDEEKIPSRKSRKSKSDDQEEPVNEENGHVVDTTGDNRVEAVDMAEQPSEKMKKKKSKKEKHTAVEDLALENDNPPAEEEVAPPVAEKELKVKKREKKKSKHAAKEAETAAGAEQEDPAASREAKAKSKKKKFKKAQPEVEVKEAAASDTDPFASIPDVDTMDVDIPASTTKPDSSLSTADDDTIHSPAHAPSDPTFPFMTQTVSLYVPLYPVGFDKPLTKAADQHLKSLLNHYSPLLKGVLLDYSNVSIGEQPRRGSYSAEDPPTDHTPAVLSCVDEYAVGFGWLTAEVYLFVPRRGAWLEGYVNLQSEGHLGVVCWSRFNASIEAARVPPGWRFVDVIQREEDEKKTRFRNGGKVKVAASVSGDESSVAGGAGKKQQTGTGAGGNGKDDLESLDQMHATGYWVDAEGKRVRGRLRFRIKNFDVGLTGDHGYISIEGTMLGDEEEKVLRERELKRERARRGKGAGAFGSGGAVSSLMRREMRRVPEFSMTRFGREEEDEDSSRRQPIYIASRPQSPA